MKEAVENPKVAFGDDEERHKSLHKTGKGHGKRNNNNSNK